MMTKFWERWRIYSAKSAELGLIVIDGDPDHYPFAISAGGDMRHWRITNNCWCELIAHGTYE